MRERRISEIIRAFDAQGDHRTGTPVDAASGEWLRAGLEEQGAEARLEFHRFDRFDPGACLLATADGRLSIPGLPLFDAKHEPASITGSLGPLGEPADIGLAIVPPAASEAGQALDRARREGRHRAIVCITVGGQPGLAPRNAPSYVEPFGPPVLQVSSKYRDELVNLASSGAAVTVGISGAMALASAANVVGRVAGRDPGLPPFVVMTPRSGWWRCASERGGGIACWLELARAFASEPLRRDVLFVASTGHELGHWGLERYLEAHPDVLERAAFWLHFGASVGAALTPRARAFASDPAIMAMALDALAKAGAPAVQAAPQGTLPGGESRNIHERGKSYLSLAGGSEVFHLEQDRWPDAVDVPAIAACTAACVSILRSFDAG